MKLVIDPAGLVTDAVALAMAAQIVDRADGTVKFTDGLAVEIRTAKTQKSFKICDTSAG